MFDYSVVTVQCHSARQALTQTQNSTIQVTTINRYKLRKSDDCLAFILEFQSKPILLTIFKKAPLTISSSDNTSCATNSSILHLHDFLTRNKFTRNIHVEGQKANEPITTAEQ